MKLCYAFRRGSIHPYYGDDLPPKEHRAGWLKAVREMGFEGIELPANCASGDEQLKELRDELDSAGLPCVCVRGGGGVAADPDRAERNRALWEELLHAASMLGAKVVNGNLITPARDPNIRETHWGASWGNPFSHSGSRESSLIDFEKSANMMTELADVAANLGIEIAIEVHQNSINDTSWSALQLMQMINRPNVGLNPDLGNIYWLYHIPEESCEGAITALAPHAKYWHCKNLYRIYIPENKHSIFLQVALPDGDINYRFAITAMHQAGYSGYLAIEGVRTGDQLYNDARSVEYVQQILAGLR